MLHLNDAYGPQLEKRRGYSIRFMCEQVKYPYSIKHCDLYIPVYCHQAEVTTNGAELVTVNVLRFTISIPLNRPVNWWNKDIKVSNFDLRDKKITSET